MYARIERFNMSQGLADLVAELADKIEPIMRRQPGFQSLTLFSDETSGEYLALTIWATLEQIHTYERSEDEWRVRDMLSPYLTAIPQIEVYQVHNLPPTPVAATPPAGSAAS